MTKTLSRLTELTAGGLSSELTNHRDFYIASTERSIIDSTIAGVQHNFYSSSHSPILDPFSSSITTLACAL